MGQNIDMHSGTTMMKYFAEKSVELEAQVRRAQAGEFADEAPALMPTAEQVAAMAGGAQDELAPAEK